MWLLLTISSSTLLDTATLKGWNLLMAEKADSSTSVCGSLWVQVNVYHALIHSTGHTRLHWSVCIKVSTWLHPWCPRCNIEQESSLGQFSVKPLRLQELRRTFVVQLLKPHNYETCIFYFSKFVKKSIIPCNPGLLFLFFSSACTAVFPSSSSSSSSSSLTRLWHHNKKNTICDVG